MTPASNMQTEILSAEDLSGPERVAVVILALGEDASKPIWTGFDEDELRDVTRAIATLGSVAPHIVEGLLADFVSQLSSVGAITGSAASAKRMLSKILPADKAASMLEELKGPAGKTMWDKLANVNERVLSSYLQNEHPQTIAVILSRINSDHAARVISSMPELLGEEVIGRMLTLGPVQQDVVDQIEKTLRTEFMSNLSRTPEKDPFESMAEIFNHFDRSTERRFIDALEQKNPTAAERIRSLMFVFEDLLNLDDQDIQILLRYLDKSDLALALKGAKDDVTSLFFRNMSERASNILRDDISIMGPVRLREVDSAQQKIVEAAKRLADQGEIFLSRAADEELVY